MLKNLAITPPVVGRISIGRVIEKNGKRLPEKDDQFTITTQVQNRDGWVLHPADQTLREQTKGGKLRTIAVTLPFNDPDLNLRADYIQFDRETGRPISVSDGVLCQRQTEKGREAVQCAATDDCCLRFADTKPYGRLYVKIGESDDLGCFIFRTTSYNSIRTLAARMRYYAAVSGGLLSCMPLELRLRGKSTTQSYRTAIYYVDLVVRSDITLEQAIAQAREQAHQRSTLGYDQSSLDAAARTGFANGVFEDADENLPSVAEEFFSAVEDEDSSHDKATAAPTNLTRQLQDKLDRQGAS